MIIDDLKLLIDAVDGMAGAALYLVVGFVFYKLLVFAGTTGAVVLILKLFITKVHDVLVMKKTTIQENKIYLDDILITQGDNNADRLWRVFNRVRQYKGADGRVNSYIYSDGVTFIVEAINSAIKKEVDRV